MNEVKNQRSQTTPVFVGVRQAVEKTIHEARVPGLVVAVARGQQDVYQLALGSDATGRALASDSLFPVASITKLATALAVLRLVKAGALTIDDPLSHHLPTADAAQPGVTIRGLLSHTAGLPLDLSHPLATYAPGLSWSSLAQACLQTPLEAPPNQRVQYGNVGYGLLAMIVEQQTGGSFADALHSLVLEPLGIEGYLGEALPRRPTQLADVRSEHVGTALEPFNSEFWRSLAFPWAGLVTTAAGALKLVRVFQGMPDDFLGAPLQAEAVQNQAGSLGGGLAPPLFWPQCPWGLGPELRGHKQPHWAPAQASQASFGHSGASGCIVWADPSADVAWALCGARTANSGWLLRRGSQIGAAVLEEVAT